MPQGVCPKDARMLAPPIQSGATIVSDDTLTESRPAPEKIDDVVIRFAGDSGDGMQLAGTQFTASSAMFGNDLATLPNSIAHCLHPSRHR